jgi:uncharacterized caspase-like protein
VKKHLTWLIPTLASIAIYLLASSSAWAEKRVALVIGNGQYQYVTPLKNPNNDAPDLAASLREIGFDVILRTDIGREGFEEALSEFARKAVGADTALFYYAGHGLQFEGQNYLLPIDVKAEDALDVRFRAVKIDHVREAMDQMRGVKILILDACRSNPLAEQMPSRSFGGVAGTRGLARIEHAEGMVISYATAIDQVAADGTDRNSPFTKALIAQLREPGLEIGAMFRRVARDVYDATGGRQQPEISVSLRAEYYLNQSETDSEVWAKIRSGADESTLRAFIERYPSSFYAPDANLLLDAIKRHNAEQAEKAAAAKREAALNDKLAALEGQQAKLRAEEQELEHSAAEAKQQEIDARVRLATAEQEREKAARDALSDSAIEPDKSAQAQREREQALRQQVEQQQAAVSVAERERIARATLEKERAEEELRSKAAEQTQLDEKARREKELRESAERARLLAEEVTKLQAEVARLTPAAEAARTAAQAAGDKVAVAREKIAMATQNEVSKATSSPAANTQADMVKSIKAEMVRIGCYFGAPDDDWSSRRMTRALQGFVHFAKLKVAPETPSQTFLDDLKARQGKVCPVVCSPREDLKGDNCVAKKCPRGETVDSVGDCVMRPGIRLIEEPKAMITRSPSSLRRTAAQAPRQSVTAGPRRQSSQPHCFNFNGNQYCE